MSIEQYQLFPTKQGHWKTLAQLQIN